MHSPDPSGARLSDAEIARRALKLLAERKLIPTPQSFAEVCQEISSGKNNVVAPATVIKDVVRDLIKAGRLVSQEGVALVEAAQAYNWFVVREGLERALARKPGGALAHWPQLTLTLLRQADALHTQWTRARKLDAIARVIEAASEQPDVAHERLTRLIESWGSAQGPDISVPMAAAPAIAPTAPTALSATNPNPTAAVQSVAQRYGSDPELQQARDRALIQAEAWKQVALRASHLLVAACGEESAASKKITAYIKENSAKESNAAQSAAATAPSALAVDKPERIAPRFIDVIAGVERHLDEEKKVRQGLQRLLAMLCDNIKTLTPDEVWLAGQLEPIRALLHQPVRPHALEQAESRLAQVIAQQGRARHGLHEAKVALKEMLSTLIESIGVASASTGTFYAQIEGYQKQLETANDFDTLSKVISGLLSDTAAVRQCVEHSRTELAEARHKVETYESRVQELERELSQVSSLVQKDPLTFALNRRGLEEAFRVEAARAARYEAPLALAVLDVDDFKHVNDSLGHAAGDRVLVHLATTLQLFLRPTDFIARFGGEEFVLLLPVTDLEGAFEAGERLRSELTRRPFVWQGEARDITFSVGVCQWRVGESLESCVQRADTAMYQAKRAGKNRVVKAG